MRERTDGSQVPGTHNLGRCNECDLAFHWKRADGVTCPNCGRGLAITTRRLREGFLPLSEADVKAIQDANGYTAIKPALRKLARRKTAVNKVAAAAWNAYQRASRVQSGDGFIYDYSTEGSLAAKAEYDAIAPQRDAVHQEERTLRRQVKGVAVEVSCFKSGAEIAAENEALYGAPKGATVTVSAKPVEPGSVVAESIEFRQAARERAAARVARSALVVDAEAPVVPARERQAERVEQIVNAGVDAILGPIEPAAPVAEAKPNRGTYPGPWAGEVKRDVSEAGTTVVLLDLRNGGEWSGSEADGGRWMTVCDAHGSVCQHRTRKLAEHHLTGAEWCEPCIELIEARIAAEADAAREAAAPAPAAEAQPKGSWGGARKGAGRKPVGEHIQAKSVSLPAAMIEALRAFGGGNLSAGIRRLHDEHFGSLGEA